MNSKPRILLVGRRFWPHGGWDSACSLLNEAASLRRAGLHVEVLTPKYESSWPEQTVIREVTVHRCCVAPRRDWSMGKYMRAMGAWLQVNGSRFDFVYVDQAREELLVAVEASEKMGNTILTRCRSGGASSDTQWWDHARNGKRCMQAARKSHGIFVDDQETQRELLLRDFSEPLIFRLPHGFYQREKVTPEERWRIRKELALANADLVTEPDTPVLLCHATMNHSSGIENLIAVSRFLLVRYPNLRIWIGGDGPARDTIYTSLRAEGVRASVAIPGSFSDPSDLFRAANLYFQPGDDGLSYFLPLAISLRLPVIAVDQSPLRRLLRWGSESHETASPGQSNTVDPALENQGMAKANHPFLDKQLEADPHLAETDNELLTWCDSQQPKTIKDGIIAVLQDFPTAARRAEKLQNIMLRERSEHQYLDAFMGAIHRFR